MWEVLVVELRLLNGNPKLANQLIWGKDYTFICSMKTIRLTLYFFLPPLNIRHSQEWPSKNFSVMPSGQGIFSTAPWVGIKRFSHNDPLKAKSVVRTLSPPAINKGAFINYHQGGSLITGKVSVRILWPPLSEGVLILWCKKLDMGDKPPMVRPMILQPPPPHWDHVDSMTPPLFSDPPGW